MTPAARVAAAIVILDEIGAGTSAEQALTRWARRSRFAGSKDRAAIRDHVFDVLRHWRSDAVRGGAATGRGRMIGRLRAQGVVLDDVFTGEGYATPELTEAERGGGAMPQDRADRLDLPEWLWPAFDASLGDQADHTAEMLQARAPVTLRVNTLKTTVEAVQDALAKDDIVTEPNPRASTALTVTRGARKLRNCGPYREGHVELQDAASQAAVALVTGQGRALDFCAGGGGKALGLAAMGWQVTAHDAAPARMKDVPDRAARGGHKIALCPPEALSPSDQFDVVFCDAPCSGSGTWRRTPEAKWALTPERLDDLQNMQAQVLATAQHHVTPRGRLFYATCSVLNAENEDQVTAFCRAFPDWQCVQSWRWPVDVHGDGFFLAELCRSTT